MLEKSRDFDKYEKQFKQRVLELVAKELDEQTHFSTTVLFGDELWAGDWTPEKAVDCLFRYASQHGWGIEP